MRSVDRDFSRATLLEDPARTTPRDHAQAGLGLADFVATLLTQRLLMATIFLLVVGVGAYSAWRMKPTYFAEAQVAIGSPHTANVGKSASVASNETNPDTALIQSEAALLQSNDLIDRMIRNIGPRIVASDLGLPEPSQYEATSMDAARKRDLIHATRESQFVERRLMSNVITIGVSATSPEGTVRLSNGMLDAYLESKADERFDAAQRAEVWLNRRIVQLSAEVEEKERAVATYRADMKLLSVSGSTLTERQYFELQQQVVLARTDLANQEARFSQLRSLEAGKQSDDAVLEAVNSATIQALRQREAEIAGREAGLRLRYFDEHPSVVAVVNERRALLDQIAAEIGRTQVIQRNEVESSRRRVAQLESALRDLEGKLVQGNSAIVRLNELERDAAASASVYADFMQRSREIAEQESLKVVDAREVSRAIEPSDPSSTSPKLWLIFSVAAGLFFAIVGALVASGLGDRIIRPERVEPRIGFSSIIAIPDIIQRKTGMLIKRRTKPEAYVVSQPNTRFAESFRVLTTKLLADVGHRKGCSIAVTSALENEGKTTTSLCLARVAAMTGLRVLAIDCDVRRPSLSTIVDAHAAGSLNEVLSGKIGWRDAVAVDPATNAMVLPIKAQSGEQRSLFHGDGMSLLLKELRPEFDLIILDCAPILAVFETRWITGVSDTSIIVSRWNFTRAAVIRTAVREIMQAQGRIAGIVLNRAKISLLRRVSQSDPLFYGQAGGGYYNNKSHRRETAPRVIGALPAPSQTSNESEPQKSSTEPERKDTLPADE